MTLDPVAGASLAELTLGGRPLIVVDVDEVLCHFVQPLVVYLEQRGYWLDLVSYGLGGNIKHAGTHRAVPKEDVAQLIQQFFDAKIGNQIVVDGAVDVLARLGQSADVVLLTNAPHRHRETRRQSLARQGVPFPLITNEGQKGPVVAALARDAIGPVIFIDDSPTNLTSVRDRVPEVRLIHFVADPVFLGLARDVPGVALKTGDWLAVESYIAEQLGDER